MLLHVLSLVSSLLPTLLQSIPQCGSRGLVTRIGGAHEAIVAVVHRPQETPSRSRSRVESVEGMSA